MRALLLAAGRATRLGRLSETTPKCLHLVGGEVLLDRIIRQLREAGVTEFLINTHHLADKVAGHIRERSDSDAFTLTYEPELLGTLGTLRANLDFFGCEPGWVLHADNFIVGSLNNMDEQFEKGLTTTWGCMMTFRSKDPTTCGVVETDEHGIVTSFHEKVSNPPTTQASGATFIFGDAVFDIVEELPTTANDLSRDLIPLLVGHLLAVDFGDGVIDVGTPEGLQAARELALNGL